VVIFRSPFLLDYTAIGVLFYIAVLAGLISVPLYLAAIIFARGRRLLTVGLGFASFFILIFFGSLAITDARTKAYLIVCQSNIELLKTALSQYSETHNGLLPDPNWCDELLKTDSLGQGNFVCKATDARRGQSTYALNKNLIGRKLTDVNPDTVMLFETKTGWNQTGEANELVFDHHNGSNIVFADGHISYVPKDRISKLRWNP
jgi:prepilin-type processing-associated H-X9-DG protein